MFSIARTSSPLSPLIGSAAAGMIQVGKGRRRACPEMATKMSRTYLQEGGGGGAC